MDEARSTTPPLPPPASSETLQLELPSQPVQPASPSPSVLSEGQEVDVAVKASGSQAQESKMDQNHQSKLPRPANSRTPEPLRVVQVSHQTNGDDHAGGPAHAAHLLPDRCSTPSTPGANLMPFDWDDLEARFEKALASANQQERELMGEFDALVKVHPAPMRIAPACRLAKRPSLHASTVLQHLGLHCFCT